MRRIKLTVAICLLRRCIWDKFSYFSIKTCCGYGYSFEAPHRGASNDYTQHIFISLEIMSRVDRKTVASQMVVFPNT